MGVGRLVVLHFTLLVASQGTTAANAQGNEWAWMGGTNTGVASNAVYGTMRISEASNIPSARYQAATWTDSSGNFWMFGGGSGYIFGGGQQGVFDELDNDLWKFNPSTKQWTWMGGSTVPNQPGVYGTLGTPSASNLPAGRLGASTWVDANGNFWMFGGNGLDANGRLGMLNDLWEYSPSSGQWTWIGGASTYGSNCFGYDLGGPNEQNCVGPGVYGTMGTPSVANIPSGRTGATSWTDQNGNYWMFGGWGYDISSQVEYFFNELWMFSPSTKQWTLMGGNPTKEGSACFFSTMLYYLGCGEPGTYGTLLTPSSANMPGGREGAMGWTDNNGKLWLYGGQGFDVNGQFDDLNDMWVFDTNAGQWTWMGGPSTVYGYYAAPTGVYGSLSVPSGNNIPTTRYSGTTWKDNSGNLWLYGGEVTGWYGNSVFGMLNDIWEFNPTTNEWAWMGGNDGTFPAYQGGVDGVYGTLGSAAPGNSPGQRTGSAAWTDQNGNFWLFGGQTFGMSIQGDTLYDNDLWEYQPSAGPLPTTAAPTFSLPSGTYSSNQTTSLSDATNGATIYYTTDGTTPTSSSQWFSPSTPLKITHSETITAYAVASGCLPSAVTSAVYTLPPQAATPTFSVPSGTYTTWQTLTISDATPGATIYYNFGGNEPPDTNASIYTGPIPITIGGSIFAVARAPGYSDSNLATASYMLNLPTTANPTFSPTNGTYNTPQTVTISDSTPNTTIYYAINQYPSISSDSTVYTGPITVSSSETIWAIALAKDHYQSSVVSGSWNIAPGAVAAAAPSFSPTGGTYSNSQIVTLTDTTSGSMIFYTTDGSTPTTNSEVYTSPLTVSSTETLNAIASANGYLNSSVATAAYTINQAAADFSVAINSTTMTVNAGQTGTANVTIAALDGFNSPATFACSGLPAGASCSFSPATVVPSGGSATTVLTVTTASRTGALNPFIRPLYPEVIAACGLLGVFWTRRRFRPLLLGFSAVGILLLSGCGGSSTFSGSSGTSGPISSTVTITASSGTLSHAITFTLVVN
jgi:hypothetical protein